jgi:toxin ParE1/3/4
MATVRLSSAADQDIVRILSHTQPKFGADTRGRYEALLAAGLRDIAAEPDRPGSSLRPELGPGVRIYHLRHCTGQTPVGWVRCPRHLLLYRVIRPDRVGVGRILPDGMEVERHLTDDYGDA